MTFNSNETHPNHLNLAVAKGLGTNRLEEIEVLGTTIEKVKKQFKPAW